MGFEQLSQGGEDTTVSAGGDTDVLADVASTKEKGKPAEGDGSKQSGI